jgi:hypothetical protein
MTTNLVRLSDGRTAEGLAAGYLPCHRFSRARDETPPGCGTTEDARFIGACIAVGALLGLLTAMARPTAEKREG